MSKIATARMDDALIAHPRGIETNTCCRWFAFQPKNILWWGGLFLSLGGIMFDFATTARLAGQFWTVHYTITESVWSAGG